MKTPIPIAIALLLGALLGAAGARPQAPPAVLDAALGERLTLALEQLPERAPLAPGEAFRAEEIGRDAHTSHHVVAIRDAETPHRHDHHDLWVVILRGHGTLRLGAETRPVGQGSILYMPRGVVHAFSNASEEPAYAYAVYAPPFDGEDRIVE